MTRRLKPVDEWTDLIWHITLIVQQGRTLGQIKITLLTYPDGIAHWGPQHVPLNPAHLFPSHHETKGKLNLESRRLHHKSDAPDSDRLARSISDRLFAGWKDFTESSSTFQHRKLFLRLIFIFFCCPLTHNKRKRRTNLTAETFPSTPDVQTVELWTRRLAD